MVEQSTAACHSLTQEADQLANLVSEFQLTRPAVSPSRKEIRKPAASSPAPTGTAADARINYRCRKTASAGASGTACCRQGNRQRRQQPGELRRRRLGRILAGAPRRRSANSPKGSPGWGRRSPCGGKARRVDLPHAGSKE